MYVKLPYSKKYMNTQQTITNKNQKEKPERLEARITKELKIRLQYAADLQGSSLSEFLLRSAEKMANEVISDHKIIKLTTEDSIAFANALLNPPEPNSKLRSAFKNFKKEVRSL